ncbi:hypothetical protein GF312_03210 [Candidatus Poribacteria bacterium]|nr:hypothetical protein [Candidatus Poribacteria bacterium]
MPLILSSHEHLYENNIIRNGGENGKIHIIVTGGGGAPLRDATSQDKIQEYLNDYKTEGFEVIPCQKIIYHYCHVKINSDEIHIRVNKITDKSKSTETAEEIFIR